MKIFNIKKIVSALLAVMLISFIRCTRTEQTSEFRSAWKEDTERVWVGPEYWANRLQDWRIANGRLECVEARQEKPIRTVHLLTRRLGAEKGNLDMRVRTGLIGNAEEVSPVAMTGFLIGAGGKLDYRAASLVHHSPGEGGGIIAAMESNGRAVFCDMEAKDYPVLAAADKVLELIPDEAELQLTAIPSGDSYNLTLEIIDPETGLVLSLVKLENVSPGRLVGNVVLVSHPGKGETTGRFWFRDWTISGSKVEIHNDRLCGPVICTQHTLSRGIMKMTAQLMPVSENDPQSVTLQIYADGRWKPVSTAKIIVPGYTATFRVENWDSSRDIPYRVVCGLKQPDGSTRDYIRSGFVKLDPVEKHSIVVAGFTGNHNVAHPGVESGIPWTAEGVWFPHNEIVDHVAAHNPDVLFFSGDQVYEVNSPTSPIKSPENKAYLDYLYKWYLWCRAFGGLARDIPCVCIPDDHDVYQGNLWGAGGRKTDKDDKGGYVMPADWVRMVERTQTSHLPDPYDPTPIEQGIGVYYTDLNYGRISFAILEDRKFKSGCSGMVPRTSGRADHVIDPDFDQRTADVPGAKLLGDLQLSFLKDWAADWRGTDMKAALSQTVFAGMATHHGPKLSYIVVDYDSNGWPQSGRNRALHEIRRAFAFMLCGDQHLSTIVHHGINDFNDAGWSFCVPSIANFYPRAWRPIRPGRNRGEGMPDYTGEFLDGLGNHVTVWAATNPGEPSGRQPTALHDKMPGYGIVRFNKPDRTITMECWPRYADPVKDGDDSQYSGWPKTIEIEDNYGRKAAAYLPTIEVSGMTDPVVRVIDETDGDIVYTLRIRGNSYRPKVFKEGSYTVNVGEPDTDNMKIIKNIISGQEDELRTIEVVF